MEGIAVLLISVANLITVLYAMKLHKELDKTTDRLRSLERRVG